jgi:hypothetical protein
LVAKPNRFPAAPNRVPFFLLVDFWVSPPISLPNLLALLSSIPVGGFTVALGIESFYRFRYWTEGNFSLIMAWNLGIFSIGLFSKVKSVMDGSTSAFTISIDVILL